MRACPASTSTTSRASSSARSTAAIRRSRAAAPSTIPTSRCSSVLLVSFPVRRRRGRAVLRASPVSSSASSRARSAIAIRTRSRLSVRRAVQQRTLGLARGRPSPAPHRPRRRSGACACPDPRRRPRADCPGVGSALYPPGWRRPSREVLTRHTLVDRGLRAAGKTASVMSFQSSRRRFAPRAGASPAASSLDPKRELAVHRRARGAAAACTCSTRRRRASI